MIDVDNKKIGKDSEAQYQVCSLRMHGCMSETHENQFHMPLLRLSKYRNAI